jgi:diadenosine tetraphosphate (Ap4A) HIT family hydrolase
MTDKLECVGSDLCDELRGSINTSFTLTYQSDPPSRMIASTSHLALLADLSPLTAGHLLLLPKDHHVSFGHVVARLGSEIRSLLDRVTPRYTDTFGPPTIVEHGSSSTMNAACISHAHWHLVPVDGQRLCRLMEKDGLVATVLDRMEDLGSMALDDAQYFYCFDGHSHRVFAVDRKMRSQYLRSLMGEILGIPDPLWDYSLVVRKDLLRQTMRAFQGADQPMPGRDTGRGP